MYKENKPLSYTPEPLPEKASDTEMVTFLIGHIDHPCEVEVAPGQIENIRNFYLQQAELLLPELTNPFIIDLLKNKIHQYKRINN